MVKKTTIEDFMGTFHIVPMETNVGNKVFSLEHCRQQILDNICFNIQHFKNNSWTNKLNTFKMLVDADKRQHLCVFTVRLGNQEIYKCNCILKDITEKLEFLNKIYEGISKGFIDSEIQVYSSKRCQVISDRKKKIKEKRKSQRAIKKEIEQKIIADAIAHMPKIKG